MAKKHVILFAGTTEGRILANWLDEQSGVTGIVCVATEYGAELLEEEMSLKHLTVHCGRLDEGAMEAFLKKESPSLVIDATHPYAQVVTANIRKACEKYPDICLLRCLRKESEDEAKDSKGDKNGIIHVKNTAEAVRYLSEKEGNIFLTTGSKELVLWQGLPGHLERIFARVLPVEASVHICRELGYSGRHIIAMQGPFSAEMNYIQLKEFQCSYMVTKDGGDTGGFKEKMQAAKKRREATAVVIDRPKDKGMSLEQTKRSSKGVDEGCLRMNMRRENPLSILQGSEMGQDDQLTGEVLDCLDRADAVMGARRMLDAAAPYTEGKAVLAAYKPSEMVNWLSSFQWNEAVLVLSGDTGFYSGAEAASKAFLQEGWEVEYIPGVSSLSYFCGRLGAAGRISTVSAAMAAAAT